MNNYSIINLAKVSPNAKKHSNELNNIKTNIIRILSISIIALLILTTAFILTHHIFLMFISAILVVVISLIDTCLLLSNDNDYNENLQRISNVMNGYQPTDHSQFDKYTIYINEDDPYDIKLPYHLIDYNISDNIHEFYINDDGYEELTINKKLDHMLSVSDTLKKIYDDDDMTFEKLITISQQMTINNNQVEKLIKNLYDMRQIEINNALIDDSEKLENLFKKFKINDANDTKLMNKMKNFKNGNEE